LERNRKKTSQDKSQRSCDSYRKDDVRNKGVGAPWHKKKKVDKFTSKTTRRRKRKEKDKKNVLRVEKKKTRHFLWAKGYTRPQEAPRTAAKESKNSKRLRCKKKKKKEKKKKKRKRKKKKKKKREKKRKKKKKKKTRKKKKKKKKAKERKKKNIEIENKQKVRR